MEAQALEDNSSVTHLHGTQTLLAMNIHFVESFIRICNVIY